MKRKTNKQKKIPLSVSVKVSLNPGPPPKPFKTWMEKALHDQKKYFSLEYIEKQLIAEELERLKYENKND